MSVIGLVNPWNWFAVPLGLIGRVGSAGLRLIKPRSLTGRVIYYAAWVWFWFPGTNTATIMYLAYKLGYEKEVLWLLDLFSGAFWWCVDTAEFLYHKIPVLIKLMEAIS